MSELRLLNHCGKCNAGWKSFRYLSKGEIEVVNSNRYEATFKPGEIMVKQGSPASNALFMATGIAKSYIEGPKGKNMILDIEKPGRLILGPGAYINSRYSYSVSAITSVQACFVTAEILKQLARANSKFAESLLEEFCSRNLRSHEIMLGMAQKRMSGRLASIILYLSDDIFGNEEFDMIFTRQELGDMANMAKECVVRILKELEDSGVINSNASGLKILDRKKLVSISENG